MAASAIVALCASALLVQSIAGQTIRNAGVVDITDVNVIGNGATGWVGNGIVDSYNAGYGLVGNGLIGNGLTGNALATGFNAGYGLAGNGLAAGIGLAGSGLATGYNAGYGLAGNGLAAGIGLAGSGLATGFGAGYGLIGNGLATTGFNGLTLATIAANTNGGAFPVSSASPIAPTGVSVWSENAIEGPLAVAGQLPVLSAVAFEGILPSAGAAGVQYGCGNGNIGIVSEGLTGFAAAPLVAEVAVAPVATGFAAAPLATGFATGPLATGFATGPLATGFAAGQLATGIAAGPLATGFAAGPIAGGIVGRGPVYY